MKFLTIFIKYIFHEHHSQPKIKIRKSSKKCAVSRLKLQIGKAKKRCVWVCLCAYLYLLVLVVVVVKWLKAFHEGGAPQSSKVKSGTKFFGVSWTGFGQRFEGA